MFFVRKIAPYLHLSDSMTKLWKAGYINVHSTIDAKAYYPITIVFKNGPGSPYVQKENT